MFLLEYLSGSSDRYLPGPMMDYDECRGTDDVVEPRLTNDPQNTPWLHRKNSSPGVGHPQYNITTGKSSSTRIYTLNNHHIFMAHKGIDLLGSLYCCCLWWLAELLFF